MGVAGLFRWLCNRYPQIISPVKEGRLHNGAAEQDLEDSSVSKDPLIPEFSDEGTDNLYLDFNGIVHTCTHPEHWPAPETEDQMLADIFAYTERVIRIVRPQKLLMIAIDGVAPRAKMNQQRSRRFRSAKEAAENEKAAANQDNVTHTWDINAITPGTPFMATLGTALRNHVRHKISTDPLWRRLKVIISDASIAGEGEHKIMQFVRSQRLLTSYDPRVRHAVYGLDADLILLCIASHESHFRILREDIPLRNATFAHRNFHGAPSCSTGGSEDAGKRLHRPFVWLSLDKLRQYLETELTVPDRSFPFSLSRALDDWVFMCTFVGNDFLPHLTTLDIWQCGIDVLVCAWRQNLVKMGGYITDNGHVDLRRAEMLLYHLNRQESGMVNAEGRSRAALTAPHQSPRGYGRAATHRQDRNPDQMRGGLVNKRAKHTHAFNRTKFHRLQVSFPQAGPLHHRHPHPSSSGWTETVPPSLLNSRGKSHLPLTNQGHVGWNDHQSQYYWSKFRIPPDAVSLRHDIASSYIKTICWVMLYYFQGCPSWTWHYPYHYAPLTSDLQSLDSSMQTFTLGHPCTPVEQLMSVMPPRSVHLVPPAFRTLMIDEDSPIIDFYPMEFDIDLNGKKFSWQGVALLPWIDEERLRDAMRSRYDDPEDRELERDQAGAAVLLYAALPAAAGLRLVCNPIVQSVGTAGDVGADQIAGTYEIEEICL